VLFVSSLIQGYGLTETCSGGTLQPVDSTADGIAGAPISCLQLRLRDCTEKVVAALSFVGTLSSSSAIQLLL
jgi:long-subunit acyl-CoA synthetase (AMP-forming)